MDAGVKPGVETQCVLGMFFNYYTFFKYTNESLKALYLQMEVSRAAWKGDRVGINRGSKRDAFRALLGLFFIFFLNYTNTS